MDTALEFQGLHAKCKVFTQDIEQMAIQQIFGFLNCPVFHGCEIRVMPDVHAGAGAVIGFTAKVGDMVIPNVVGVDLGCGVQTVDLGYVNMRGDDGKPWFEWFDKLVRARVPSGFTIRNNALDLKRLQALYTHYIAPANVSGAFAGFQRDVDALADKIGMESSKVWRSLGTLGGGNHFIEIDSDGKSPWLTVHSGSRNFGLRVAEYHQHKALARMGKNGGLEWLEGEDAQEYLRDMRLAQRYAMLNRLAMLDALTNGLGIRLEDKQIVTSVHNFIGDDDIIRKGAISARAGETVVIPWNMRDGLVVGRGKGNPDWNYSAPHGSGRKLARGKAKRELSVDEFKATMAEAGVWSSCIGKDTLDESPMAYKDTDTVREAIGETVEVVKTLKPVYNFKAGGE